MTQKKTVDERAGSGGEEMRCTWYLEMMRNVAIFYYQTADEVKKKKAETRRGASRKKGAGITLCCGMDADDLCSLGRNGVERPRGRVLHLIYVHFRLIALGQLQ